MDLTVRNFLVVRRRGASEEAEAGCRECRDLDGEQVWWPLLGWFMNIPVAR